MLEDWFVIIYAKCSADPNFVKLVFLLPCTQVVVQNTYYITTAGTYITKWQINCKLGLVHQLLVSYEIRILLDSKHVNVANQKWLKVLTRVQKTLYCDAIINMTYRDLFGLLYNSKFETIFLLISNFSHIYNCISLYNCPFCIYYNLFAKYHHNKS